MTTEVNQEVEATQDDEAAFEAGFAEARGEESPADPTTVEPTAELPETEQEAAPVEKVEPAANPDDEPFLDNLTKADVKRLLAQASHVEGLQNQLQKAHGRLGELNMRMQQISSSPKAAPKEFIDGLSKIGYDDLAELLKANPSALSVNGGNTFDPETIRAEFNTKLSEEAARIKAEQELQFGTRLLSMKHKGWQAVRRSDDFVLWENQLPEAERIELNTTNDPVYISEAFDTFKEWRNKAVEQKQKKQDRLEAAVTPTRGAPAPVTSVNDDAAFEAGFRTVRR